MKNFEENFNKLNLNSKNAVNAYRSGRQFMVTGINTFFPGIRINNRLYPTIISSIVNEIFACELFLKSMLMIKNGNNTTKKHKLLDLYDSLDNEDIEKYLLKYEFRKELEKISNSFVMWRYCYEYDSIIINSEFVFDFCSTLEKINREKIFEEYNLDMEKSFI